jgi:gamma-tubulin complex component 5
MLFQVRRARTILERRAYLFVRTFALGTETTEAKLVQAMLATLLHFVNTVYAYLTDCTITPMTKSMREKLQDTDSVDAMIAVHGAYMTDLEHACLCSKRITPLRESLISVLDLCIRFADLVSSSQGKTMDFTRSKEDDEETRSYTSARSRRKDRGGHVHDSDDDDEDDIDDELGGGEGFSAFVLDDTTSVMQEIKTINTEFSKNTSFLVSGLRGVARASGEVGELLELLAERVEAMIPRRRDRYQG